MRRREKCPQNRSEKTMRATRTIVMAICLAVIVAAGSTVSGLAQMKEGVRPGVGVKAGPPRGKTAPLTTNECQGLGGEVMNANTQQCSTGRACKTTTVDSRGVKQDHVQCITKLD
jgi:hypothetical protein